MKKISKLVLILLLAVALVACGKSGGDGKVTVTFAKENDVISMDSRLATDGFSFEIIAATIDGLMSVDKDGNVIYALAKSHTVSEDQLVWTFNLREASWSDGSALVADDFVFAWQDTITRPEAEYNYLYTGDAASIANAEKVLSGELPKEALGIKALDDHTLEITLSKPVSFFDSLMSFPVFFPISRAFAEAQGDQYGLTPANLLASGPYQMMSWDRGSKIVLAKNEHYWDKANVHSDELVFNIVAEASTAVLDFEGGSTDFVKLNSDLVDKYKDKTGFTNILDGYLWYNQYNYDNKYLANKNIRMALSLAIDREQLVSNVLKDGSVVGMGFVPVGLATGPDGKDYRDTADVYLSMDKEKAKEYFALGLQELGVSSISLRFLYEGSDPAKPAAEFIHSELTSTLAGLNLEMVNLPKANRLTLQREGDFDIVLTRWGPDFADPTTYIGLMVTDGNYNFGHFSSSAFDTTYRKALVERDLAVRWQLLKDAEKILMDEAGVAPIFQVGGATLINPKVSGIETHAVGVPFIYKNVSKGQ